MTGGDKNDAHDVERVWWGDGASFALTRCFHARGTDVLRNVVRRHDDLGKRNVVVWDKNNFEEITDISVVVDDRADGVNKTNNALRHVITRRRLATKDRDAVNDASTLGRSHSLDRVVPMDAVQRVEQLAFVLVDAFHLHTQKKNHRRQVRKSSNHASSHLKTTRPIG